MTDSPATRQSLLVRLRNPRDGQAWAEFVAIYTPLINRLARARGLQAADAADLWAADQIHGEFRQSTWQAFWLTAVEGQDARAAARASGILVGAVYIARSRVLARLRSIVEQVQGETIAWR